MPVSQNASWIYQHPRHLVHSRVAGRYRMCEYSYAKGCIPGYVLVSPFHRRLGRRGQCRTGKQLLDDKWKSQPMAKHRTKFGDVEDSFNRRWKEGITPGKWITFDKIRVARWYNSPITMGPEPKPIRTGATMHSLCVMKGPLATYKLYVRTYGVKLDKNLTRECSHTGSVQKWVNLLDEVLDG